MISSSLTTAITNADILQGYKIDHSLITTHLASNNNHWGPGFWKFSEYIELIKKTSDEVTMENRNNDDADAVLLLDTMKMQIRSKLAKICKRKKKAKKGRKRILTSF